VIDVIKSLATVGSNISQALKGFGNASRKSNLCNEIVPAKSFIRLDNPLFKKLGGGIRVKKVEVFDNFNHMSHSQQQDAIYGQEYDYSTTAMINNVPTRISSGVASYEPAIGGEENPFHIPIEFTEKIAPLAPADYKYTEEPLGETYFPGPSVGYSKVTVQSTAKDKKSATGREETQFYTTYDFPTMVEFTPLDNESKKPYAPGLANFLRFAARHDITLSQGFKVELNDMNGKIKSQASYPQNDPANPISYTYNYYNVENENTLQKKLSGNVQVADSTNGVVTSGQLGKDIEVMVDIREQTSSTMSASVQANVDVIPALFGFPFPITTFIPAGSSESNRYRSIAVMKVVNRYGILDSVIHMEKGSKVSTKNMVYDGETGEVTLSRTNNEYDDPIYNFNYPAHWAYSGMGPAYKNISATWSSAFFRQGRMLDKNMQPFNSSRYFESGDELWVQSPLLRFPLTSDICSPLYYIFYGPATWKPVWALEASKGKEGTKGIFFIDKDGLPFSAGQSNVRITRSGKRNMSSTPVGSITSLQNPLKLVSGATRFVFDSTTQVVTAGAAT
ncbi:MAG TPA: hypothetical protein VLD19_02950, partial [Chitinophagaceae bacterium]|nr:hypothetical protein [Chitinophagaceae bacterium]